MGLVGVAVGTLPRGGYSLAIIDLQAAKLQDESWCYGYSLSPHGRYLLIRTHYPKMGLPDHRRSILLLYDLQATARQNRPSGVEDFNHDNAGLPVHPAKNRELQSYDLLVDTERLYAPIHE